jgi:hypothetical protein
MRRPLVLKGFIKGTPNGSYDGVCLTLNLAVRGRSIEEAEQKLHDLILAYLDDAQKSGTWNDLVPRKAPFSYYQQYYFLRLLSHFRSIAEFKLFVCSAPCPAHA